MKCKLVEFVQIGYFHSVKMNGCSIGDVLVEFKKIENVVVVQD